MKAATLELTGADTITREMLGGTDLLSVKQQLCVRFDMSRAGEGKPSGSVGLPLGVLA